MRDNFVGLFVVFFTKPGGGYVQTLLNINNDEDGDDGDDDCNGNNLVELFVVFSPNEGEGRLRRC